MTNLIDREALLEAGDVTKMDVAFEDWNRLDNATKRHIANYGKAVRRLVEAAPAVDAVEVVRCGKCKWGIFRQNWLGIESFKCELFCADISPKDFCSYGERKEA